MDITDFSLLQANFMRSGPIIAAAPLGSAANINGNAAISLHPVLAAVNVGASFVRS